MRHLLAPLVGALALAWAQCAWAVDTVIELPPGTTTWTVPSDWSSTNKIICIGAGAGGSGGTTTGGGTSGAGGGAGAYGEIDNVSAATLGGTGNVLTVQAGTHGSGGGTTGTSFGTAGTDTYFNASSLANAVTQGVTKACGGEHGSATTASGITGGVGGTTTNSTGTTKFAGGAGGTVGVGNGPAGGGGAGGSTGTGGAGGAGGAGGSGPSGSGGGAINAGTAGGAGGSGVTAGSGGTVTGGSGGAGGAFPSGAPSAASGGNGGGGGGGTFSTSPGNGGAGSAPSTWTTNPGGVNFGPGSGGGSGGAHDAAGGTGGTSGAGANLGGGGAGGANSNNDATFAAGGNGGDGGIIIIYTPSAGGGATPTSPMLHGIDYQTQSHLLDDLVYHPSGKPITPVWFPHGLASGGGACPFTTSLADGCAGAQANGTTIYPHLADTGKVIFVNVVVGSGYTNGTGYALSASGCTGSGFAGTIDVVSNKLTNPVISNMGSGYTCRPTISVPAGAGAGSGGSLTPTVYQKTPHNAATTFSLPGVDYGVGLDTTLSLKDPTVGGNLPGCASVSGVHVSINSAPCTFNGFDFTITTGAYLTVAASLGTTNLVTISNNKFLTPASGQPGGLQLSTGTCDVLIKNNVLSDSGATLGGTPPVAYSAAMQSQCSQGNITVEYNYCHDTWAKCYVYIGVPGSVQTVNITELYNFDRNINLNAAGQNHGETEYTFSGTTNEHVVLDCEFMTDIDDWTAMAQNLSPEAANTACGEADGVTLVGPVIKHNMLLHPGPYLATGSDNSANNLISGGANIFAGDQESGVVSPTGTMLDNYLDYTGAWFPYNATGGTLPTDFPSHAGVNAVTGNSCNTTTCN